MHRSVLLLCALGVLTFVDKSEGQDGSKIAFLSGRANDNENTQHDIWIMETDGSNPIQLTNESAPLGNSEIDNIGLDWSPDGTQIAFESFRDEGKDIWIMEADGSNPVNLTGKLTSLESQTSFSPEGKLITITPTSSERHPSWSSDGTQIAFTSNRDGNPEIYVMDADGTNLVKLTNNAAIDQGPDWSPDGTQIAFMSSREGDRDIYVMEADGTNPVKLTGGEGKNRDAAWSPDGTQFAFMSNREGLWQIWVMNRDGSNPTKLTQSAGGAALPHWSPDGTKIVYTDVPLFGGPYIRMMDANGENKVTIVERFGEGNAIDIAINWSPVLGLTSAIEATSWGKIKLDSQ